MSSQKQAPQEVQHILQHCMILQHNRCQVRWISSPLATWPYQLLGVPDDMQLRQRRRLCQQQLDSFLVGLIRGKKQAQLLQPCKAADLVV